MEFVKKNWAKMALLIFSLIGVVLTTLLLIKGPVKDLSLGEFANDMLSSERFMLIAQELFFVALTLYFMLSMFEVTKPYATYILFALSVVALIFAILSITSASDYVKHAKDQIENGLNLAKTLPSGVNIPDIGNITKEAFVNKLEVSKFELTTGTYSAIINLIIFAVLPIIYSVKKLINQRQN